jgi:hypothetical protein
MCFIPRLRYVTSDRCPPPPRPRVPLLCHMTTKNDGLPVFSSTFALSQLLTVAYHRWTKSDTKFGFCRVCFQITF